MNQTDIISDHDHADLFLAALKNQGFDTPQAFLDAAARIPAQPDPCAIADYFDADNAAPLLKDRSSPQ
jgi:hypothetical protein